MWQHVEVVALVQDVRLHGSSVACGVPVFGRHAATSYSWSNPPSRSRRRTSRGEARAARGGVGAASGALSPRTRCGRWAFVVTDILGHYPFKLAAMHDEHPVEALPPYTTDHTFADRVGPGRSHWRLDHVGVNNPDSQQDACLECLAGGRSKQSRPAPLPTPAPTPAGGIYLPEWVARPEGFEPPTI